MSASVYDIRYPTMTNWRLPAGKGRFVTPPNTTGYVVFYLFFAIGGIIAIAIVLFFFGKLRK